MIAEPCLLSAAGPIAPRPDAVLTHRAALTQACSALCVHSQADRPLRLAMSQLSKSLSQAPHALEDALIGRSVGYRAAFVGFSRTSSGLTPVPGGDHAVVTYSVDGSFPGVARSCSGGGVAMTVVDPYRTARECRDQQDRMLILAMHMGASVAMIDQVERYGILGLVAHAVAGSLPRMNHTEYQVPVVTALAPPGRTHRDMQDVYLPIDLAHDFSPGALHSRPYPERMVYGPTIAEASRAAEFRAESVRSGSFEPDVWRGEADPVAFRPTRQRIVRRTTGASLP